MLYEVITLRVCYPKDRWEAERMVATELARLRGPTAILMPYGPAEEHDECVLHETDEAFARPEVVHEGSELVVCSVGNRHAAALAAVEELRGRGVDAGP